MDESRYTDSNQFESDFLSSFGLLYIGSSSTLVTTDLTTPSTLSPSYLASQIPEEGPLFSLEFMADIPDLDIPDILDLDNNLVSTEPQTEPEIISSDPNVSSDNNYSSEETETASESSTTGVQLINHEMMALLKDQLKNASPNIEPKTSGAAEEPKPNCDSDANKPQVETKAVESKTGDLNSLIENLYEKFTPKKPETGDDDTKTEDLIDPKLKDNFDSEKTEFSETEAEDSSDSCILIDSSPGSKEDSQNDVDNLIEDLLASSSSTEDKPDLPPEPELPKALTAEDCDTCVRCPDPGCWIYFGAKNVLFKGQQVKLAHENYYKHCEKFHPEMFASRDSVGEKEVSLNDSIQEIKTSKSGPTIIRITDLLNEIKREKVSTGSQADIPYENEKCWRKNVDIITDPNMPSIDFPEGYTPGMEFNHGHNSCLGCKERYPTALVVKDGRSLLVPRPDYLVHCIFKCRKYQRLDLVKFCTRCNRFFMNPDQLKAHRKKDKCVQRKEWTEAFGHAAATPKRSPKKVAKKKVNELNDHSYVKNRSTRSNVSSLNRRKIR